jgi:hypothetical protein
VRHAKNVLSCAFAYGKERIHGVKSSPCQGVKVTVPKVRRDRWLTDALGRAFLPARGLSQN